MVLNSRCQSRSPSPRLAPVAATPRFLSLFFCWFFLITHVSAEVNRTVDDATSNDGHGAGLSFTGKWQAIKGGGPDGLDASKIRGGTFHQYVPGSGPASFDFTFTGSGVFLYFIVPVSKADGDYTQFKFSLDGNEGWAAAYNSNLRPASEGVDYNLLVFQAPFTNIGDHRLVVSLVARQEDPSYRQNHLLFDYVVYRSHDDEVGIPPPPPPQSPSTDPRGGPQSSRSTSRTSSPTSSTTSSSSPSTTRTSSSTNTTTSLINLGTFGTPSSTPLPTSSISGNSQSNTQTNGAERGSSKGAIAGAVVGSIAVVALLVAIYLFFMRRKQKRVEEQFSPKPLDLPPDARVSAFDLTSNPGLAQDPFQSPVISPKRALMIATAGLPYPSPIVGPISARQRSNSGGRSNPDSEGSTSGEPRARARRRERYPSSPHEIIGENPMRESRLSSSTGTSSAASPALLNEMHRLRAEMTALRVQVSLTTPTTGTHPLSLNRHGEAPPAY